MTQQVRIWLTTPTGKVVPAVGDEDGNFVIQLEGATVNIGDVDVLSLPSGNLGAQAKAAALCVNPATDIADGVYVGDIKFGESLPAGTALLGKVGIDQVTANANEVVVKSGATKDNGPAWTVTRTYTTSADMTTAAAISPAASASMKLVADDILISSAVAMEFSIQQETEATVLASVFIPANGTVQITMRDGLKTATAVRKFYGKASVAGNVRITCCTHEEA